MQLTPDDNLMRAAFAPARSLEPTDAEIAQVLERAARPVRARRATGAPRRLLVPGLVGLVLLGGGAYAVPTTRAALEDVADSFSAWVAGEESDAPGRPLSPDEVAPAFLRDTRYGDDPRVIAQAGRYRLFVTRQADGAVTFELGNTGVGMGFPIEHLTEDALYVLGPGAMRYADENGHVPLFGATARSVAKVELVYESGPPTRADASEGGFVLLAEPARSPHEVVAYDAEGTEVDRQLVDDSSHDGSRIDWVYFIPASPENR